MEHEERSNPIPAETVRAILPRAENVAERRRAAACGQTDDREARFAVEVTRLSPGEPADLQTCMFGRRSLAGHPRLHAGPDPHLDGRPYDDDDRGAGWR